MQGCVGRLQKKIRDRLHFTESVVLERPYAEYLWSEWGQAGLSDADTQLLVHSFRRTEPAVNLQAKLWAGTVGQTITFNGSGSHDPDGDTLTCANRPPRWSWPTTR